jgi:peptidoglycan/xylan/chitin deacetylase (PgdA/CDA1 family)
LEKKKKNILFDINTVPGDWYIQDADIIAQKVINQIKPGEIILLHDGGEGSRFATVKATDIIIRELKKRGFKFATISQLLAHSAR